MDAYSASLLDAYYKRGDAAMDLDKIQRHHAIATKIPKPPKDGVRRTLLTQLPKDYVKGELKKGYYKNLRYLDDEDVVKTKGEQSGGGGVVEKFKQDIKMSNPKYMHAQKRESLARANRFIDEVRRQREEAASSSTKSGPSTLEDAKKELSKLQHKLKQSKLSGKKKKSKSKKKKINKIK